jgi:hypothetical protein
MQISVDVGAKIHAGIATCQRHGGRWTTFMALERRLAVPEWVPAETELISQSDGLL